MHTHHSSLEALEASSKNGCHLCSLLFFGLSRTYELLGEDRVYYSAAMSSKVELVFHRSQKPSPKEEVEVFYGDRFTLFSLTNPPNQKCYSDGFDEAAWRDNCEQKDDEENAVPGGQFKVRFHARCMKSANPIWGHKTFQDAFAYKKPMRGIRKLITYMPGQVRKSTQ